MRLELWFFLATVFVLGNVYHDGGWLRLVLSHKKYIQMAAIAAAAYSLYWIFRSSPRASAAATAAACLRGIDPEIGGQLGPLLDRFGGAADPAADSSSLRDRPALAAGGGVRLHRRSLGEAKKKAVAARQGWKCGHCHQMLAASYEIDHVHRLEWGGSNDAANLVALCRNCHGEKTSQENW